MTASESATAADSDTATGSDTGTITTTDTLTDTTNYGSGGTIAGGGDWDSLQETGSDSSSGTTTDTLTTTESDGSSYSTTNTTTGEADATTLTDSQTETDAGGTASSTTETTTLTLGSAGLASGGTISETLQETGWSTDTLAGTTTQTAKDSTSVGDNTGNATDSETNNLTVTSTITAGESDSLTDTLNDLSTLILGTAATISTGGETTTLTSSGTVVHLSDHETDSDTGTSTGSSSSSLGATQSSATYSDYLTASPTIQEAGTGSDASSVTESFTLGSGGTVSAGTSVYAGSQAQTIATQTLSEVQTTTESQSTSDTATASGSSDSSLDRATLTGTLTDTITDNSPSTLTETDGGTITFGAAGLVSGGTATDSLYETSSDSASDTGAGMLTSTETTTLSSSDAGESTQGGTTATSTLVDSSLDTSGGPTTQTETQSQALGSNAVVASGAQTDTLWSSGWESSSLYQVDDAITADGGSLDQPGGGGGALVESDGLGGGETATMTVTDFTTLSATQAVTLVLGSDATIASGHSSDWSYESGNDSTIGYGTGTLTHQIADSGENSQSSTYTTTFSATDTGGDHFTESQSDVAALTTAGAIASGTDLSSLTDSGTASSTYAEAGGRTVSFGPSNEIAGSYTDTETTTQSDADFDSTSLGLGSNGTIAGGTDSFTSTDRYSDSQTDIETGFVGYFSSDGTYDASYSQLSINTDDLLSTDDGTQTLGAGGLVSGGNNSFTFDQANSDSHSIVANTATDIANDTGSDYYLMDMTGTETDGPGGTVSGGADSYTWDQSDYDLYVLTEGNALVSSDNGTLYLLTVYDQLVDDFNDTGTDILGGNDSILGGCDTYTWGTNRDLATTLFDWGSSAAPMYVSAYAWDDLTQEDTGASTLTTNGHVYATDTIGYVENTGDTATDTESSSTLGSGWGAVGQAYDYYIDTDNDTQTISDTVTTSMDSFDLIDTHTVSGDYSTSEASSGGTIAWGDIGVDVDTMTAEGEDGQEGDQYTFANTESSYDDFTLVKTFPGAWNGTMTEDQSLYQASQGTNWETSQGASSFTYDQQSTSTNAMNDSGETTYSATEGSLTWLTSSPFAMSESFSAAGEYAYGGMPETVATEGSTSTDTTTGSNPSGVNFTETHYAGQGDTAGSGAAAAVGGTAGEYSAEHLGTSPDALDGTAGLLSAMGGMAVHGLLYAGADVAAKINPTGTGLWLEESYQSSGHPVEWQSHPSGLGYRRTSTGISGGGSSGSGSGSGSGGGSGGIAGNSPEMDSGTSDGSDADELVRLQNFDTGANENANTTQAAPTSRAEQVTNNAPSAAGGNGSGVILASFDPFDPNSDPALPGRPLSPLMTSKPLGPGQQGMMGFNPLIGPWPTPYPGTGGGQGNGGNPSGSPGPGGGSGPSGANSSPYGQGGGSGPAKYPPAFGLPPTPPAGPSTPPAPGNNAPPAPQPSMPTVQMLMSAFVAVLSSLPLTTPTEGNEPEEDDVEPEDGEEEGPDDGGAIIGADDDGPSENRMIAWQNGWTDDDISRFIKSKPPGVLTEADAAQAAFEQNHGVRFVRPSRDPAPPMTSPKTLDQELMELAGKIEPFVARAQAGAGLVGDGVGLGALTYGTIVAPEVTIPAGIGVGVLAALLTDDAVANASTLTNPNGEQQPTILSQTARGATLRLGGTESDANNVASIAGLMRDTAVGYKMAMVLPVGATGTAGAGAASNAQEQKLTFFRGMTRGSALEVVESQSFDVARIRQNQLLAGHTEIRQGVFITSQEGTAQYFADLAGVQGRGLGPAVVRIEVPASDFAAFANRFQIPVEQPMPEPPLPGLNMTETLIPFRSAQDFEAFAKFFLH